MKLVFLVATISYMIGSYLFFSRKFAFRRLSFKFPSRQWLLNSFQSLLIQLTAYSLLHFITQSSAISLPLSVVISYLPRIYLTHQRKKINDERRKSWPLVVDQLASATASGVSLHHALLDMEERGPKPLKAEFDAFVKTFQVEGSLEKGMESLVKCADAHNPNEADKTAHRLKSTILIARDCGGQEIGPILRSLSNYLRQRERTYNEIVVRQEWIKNGAALASITPWLLLLLLSFHSQTVSAYSNPGGRIVLFVGFTLTILAYKWISRIANSLSLQRGS